MLGFFCVCVCVTLNCGVGRYIFIGLWAGLHQVHPLGVDLDQGQDVSVPDGRVQNLQSGLCVGTETPSEAFFRVLRSDEVFPRLPDNMTHRAPLVRFFSGGVTRCGATHMSLLGAGLVTSCRSASMISLKLAFPTFLAS